MDMLIIKKYYLIMDTSNQTQQNFSDSRGASSIFYEN
jgi:hypothetical protein